MTALVTVLLFLVAPALLAWVIVVAGQHIRHESSPIHFATESNGTIHTEL